MVCLISVEYMLRAKENFGLSDTISCIFDTFNIGVGRFRILGGGGKVKNIGGPRGAKFPAGT